MSQTILYATSKCNIGFTVTVEEISVFLGIENFSHKGSGKLRQVEFKKEIAEAY